MDGQVGFEQIQQVEPLVVVRPATPADAARVRALFDPAASPDRPLRGTAGAACPDYRKPARELAEGVLRGPGFIAQSGDKIVGAAWLMPRAGGHCELGFAMRDGVFSMATAEGLLRPLAVEARRRELLSLHALVMGDNRGLVAALAKSGFATVGAFSYGGIASLRLAVAAPGTPTAEWPSQPELAAQLGRHAQP